MGTTPTRSLPYPEASDPADVPADMQELATAVDTAFAADDGRLDTLEAADTALQAADAALDTRVDALEAAPPGGGGDFTLIADQVVAAPQAAFTFAAIPQTYTHLRLTFSGRGTAAAAIVNTLLRFNDDAGANYDGEFVSAAGASLSAADGVGQTSAAPLNAPGATATANLAAGADMTIYDYRGVFYKTGLAILYMPTQTASGNLWVMQRGFSWRNVAAVTKITLAPSSGSWATGSRATLYGLT